MSMDNKSVAATSDNTSVIEVIDGFLKKVIQGFAWFSYAGMAAIVMLLLADVFGRFFLHVTVPGSVEIVSLLLVIVVFFAIPYTDTQEGGHLVVDMVINVLPQKVKTILYRFVTLLSSIFFGLVAWQAGLNGWEDFGSPTAECTAMLNVSLVPFYFLVAFGCSLFCLHMLVSIFRQPPK
jgi:TRAP-type C4-dicarboxylate transport system permease small subunit